MSAPRSTPGRRLKAWTIVALCVLVLPAALAACGGSHPGRASTSAPLGFRSPPSFLPTTGTPVDQVLTATPAHPQLAAQGVSVKVETPDGDAVATVTGPAVPPFVSPPPPQVTAVFDVSLRHIRGTIPVQLDDFTITDQLGRSFHPALVQGAAAPPSTLGPNATASFQLTAVMPTGEGRLYWSPTRSTPYVGWDFIVEND